MTHADESAQRPAAVAPGPGAAPGEAPFASGPGPAIASTPAFRSVGFTVSSTGYAVAKRFREVLAPVGLEPREFALLRAVGAAEGRSQQATGDSLGIPPSRMVAFVDGLEARGLLERRQNPDDRRARALHLTPAGREALEQAFARAVGHERALCADLSEDERETLMELLARVGARIGARPGTQAEHGHAALADE